MSGLAALGRVAGALRSEGGLLAEVVVDPPDSAETPYGDEVIGGDRVRDAPDEYAFVIEAIREGHLLHGGEARIIATDDPDLALLAGDRLYALGLGRLAELGDLTAVAALAEVISQCARAQAAGDPGLAADAWRTGVRRVGWRAGVAPEKLVRKST